EAQSEAGTLVALSEVVWLAGRRVSAVNSELISDSPPPTVRCLFVDCSYHFHPSILIYSFRSISGLPRPDLPTLLNPCRRYIATRACGEIPLSEGRASSVAALKPCRRAVLIAASI